MEALKKAAHFLAEAEAPLIHAGGGVLQADASQDLMRLAEHIKEI